MADVAGSYRRLGIAVDGARRANGALRQSFAAYLELAPQDVFEAIDAIDNADECCIYLRNFTKIVVATLEAALGEQ